MAADSTLSPFVASDGDHIVIQGWPLEAGVSWRLNPRGIAVRGFPAVGAGAVF